MIIRPSIVSVQACIWPQMRRIDALRIATMMGLSLPEYIEHRLKEAAWAPKPGRQQ